MIKIILASLGLTGGIICILGYLPQVTKLFKLKKSSQFSVLGWTVWLFASVLLLVYAISIKNFVYITLETLHTVFVSLIFILIIVFREKSK